MTSGLLHRAWRITVFAALLQVASPGSMRASGDPADALDGAYRCMYGLNFDSARILVAGWEAGRPEDPRGPVSEAAAILFAEFNRLGILEMQFLSTDRTYTDNASRKPDPEARVRFDLALARGETLARQALERHPDNKDALFALTLANGLRADYAALIESKKLESLQHTLKASELAKKLLKLDPEYYDAYLATGISQYIVGSLVFPIRWLMRLGGYSGDRQEGLRQLRLVAEKGALLAPFARLLLAISYVRAAAPGQARAYLVGLRDEFPTNPLFSREIERIDRAKR